MLVDIQHQLAPLGISEEAHRVLFAFPLVVVLSEDGPLLERERARIEAFAQDRLLLSSKEISHLRAWFDNPPDSDRIDWGITALRCLLGTSEFPTEDEHRLQVVLLECERQLRVRERAQGDDRRTRRGRRALEALAFELGIDLASHLQRLSPPPPAPGETDRGREARPNDGRRAPRPHRWQLDITRPHLPHEGGGFV